MPSYRPEEHRRMDRQRDPTLVYPTSVDLPLYGVVMGENKRGNLLGVGEDALKSVLVAAMLCEERTLFDVAICT